MEGASSVPARETTREDEQACDAAGQSKRQRDHCAPDDVQNTLGGNGKRVRSCDNGGGSGSIVRYDGRQLYCSDEETQSLLFLSNPRAAASGTVQDPTGSRENAQQFSFFKIDPTKHKIFLSHSGTQKNFVEQLCVDLEARGYFFPFFDQRHHSLPKGKDFVPLIKQAARQCHVAVIVLSEEFLSSKWPMIELAEFHAARQGGNDGMNMLPLFYKLSVGDLDDQNIKDRWMPKWSELVSQDKRVDVTHWAAAVRALRGANGLRFGKNTNSEVAYRKEIVQTIWKLSPGDLLHDSARDMVGYRRICETVSNSFVEGTVVGSSVLGLYGTSGLGKTTLSKALCDYFAGEFMGRVCHVELGETNRMKRQELMLTTLCGIGEDVLSRLTDDRKGLKLMRDCMNREPVFLVIDNLNNDVSLRKEAHEYLTVGFHPKSKIMITARSKEVLQDLLPGLKFCRSIPRLNEEEAGMIFLKSAAPMKCFSFLTDEERRILRLCTEKCLLESNEDNIPYKVKYRHSPHLTGLPSYGAYHPLALSALGDFFYKFSANTEMLRWKDSLVENNELMRDVLQSPSITSIIRLQFSTLSSSEQLLFLDIALYLHHMGQKMRNYEMQVEWLSALHGEMASVIKGRLRDLKRSGMIDWNGGLRDWKRSGNDFEFRVHSLYKEFAMWYVTEHGVNGLKNVWGVFHPCGTSLVSEHLGSKHISDLVRLRVFDTTRASLWILARKRMQELQNLVLLQLYSCTNLRVLSLEGLDSLRHLELVGLSQLVTVTLTESSCTQESGGIFGSLQYVVLKVLDSLTQVPDFRSCTSLRYVEISFCQKVTNFKGVECPHLRELRLHRLGQHQLGRPPNFRSLHSLKFLDIDFGGNCYINLVGAMDLANPYDLKRRSRGEGAGHQYSEGLEGVIFLHHGEEFEETTIENVHLKNRSEKQGLSILQKVLSYLYLHGWRQISRWPQISYSHEVSAHLRWSFYEDDKEELYGLDCVRSLEGNMQRVIKWQFMARAQEDNQPHATTSRGGGGARRARRWRDRVQ